MAVHDFAVGRLQQADLWLAFSILFAEPPPSSSTLPSGSCTQLTYAFAARSDGPDLNFGDDELSRSITFVDEVAGQPPPMTMSFCRRMLPSQHELPKPRRVGFGQIIDFRELVAVERLPETWVEEVL